MKDYIKIIVFISSFLIILAALSAFFDGSFWYTNGYVANRDARLAAIELEEPGQIDVLNVGSSLCSVSLTPLELYRDYGITSYNMSRDLQTRAQTYYAVRAALRRQKIKVLLWETDNLCRVNKKRKNAGKNAPIEDQEDEYREEFEDITLPYKEELSEFFYYHFPALRYHSCWVNCLSGTRRAEFYKGFQVKKEIMEPAWKNSGEGRKDEIARERAEKLRARIASENELKFKMDQMYTFKRIYNLCKANNIKLVLYSAPSMKYYRSRRKHDALTKLAKQYGIDYIDGNFDEDTIGIDWTQDSLDGGAHLNLYGSRKMTKYLGEYLSRHCELTDHRGDPAYAEWADMKKYEEECGE